MSIIFAMVLNLIYALVGTSISILMMILGYKLLDKITPFDTGKELDQNNSSVGIVVAGVFISIGLAVGLTVGLGLN